MIGLSALEIKENSPYGGWIPCIAAFGIASALVFAPMPADAAPVPAERPVAKVIKSQATIIAAQDVEETGSIKAQEAGDPTCSKSRKRLFVEGEGWIVRKVTTCY